MYLWEGNVHDCSIEDSVQAWCPAPVLFKAGELSWIPGTREWCMPDDTSVAQHREGIGHSALLAREDWLKRTLRKTGHSIVFRWFGKSALNILFLLGNQITRIFAGWY